MSRGRIGPHHPSRSLIIATPQKLLDRRGRPFYGRSHRPNAAARVLARSLILPVPDEPRGPPNRRSSQRRLQRSRPRDHHHRLSDDPHRRSHPPTAALDAAGVRWSLLSWIAEGWMQSSITWEPVPLQDAAFRAGSAEPQRPGIRPRRPHPSPDVVPRAACRSTARRAA